MPRTNYDTRETPGVRAYRRRRARKRARKKGGKVNQVFQSLVDAFSGPTRKTPNMAAHKRGGAATDKGRYREDEVVQRNENRFAKSGGLEKQDMMRKRRPIESGETKFRTQ
jgi:hypothetical protein